MPWEITIRAREGAELGSLLDVEKAISSALPQIEFYTDPSGIDKIAAAKNAGVTFPPSIEEDLRTRLPAREGVIEGTDFSVTFYLGFERDVNSVAVEIRGNTKMAGGLLELLASTTGWLITEHGSSFVFGHEIPQ